MLKRLYIKNLVLVEEATVEFSSGLTVITGETGSGKTVLIEALRLLVGERADSSKVRKGCDKALVQAAFDLPKSSTEHLEEAGISYAPDEELILTREILASGKGRAYISGQMVPASLLKKIAPYLIDFIGQHAQVLLKSTEEQEKMLDAYCQLNLKSFQKSLSEEKRLEKELRELIAAKASGEALNQKLEAQIEELSETSVQDGEDEALFEEYTLLANAQELLSLSATLLQATEEATEKSLTLQKGFEKLVSFDKGLEEADKMGKEVHLNLSEMTQALQSFQAKVESDPGRLVFLEERLKLLDHLKKKYGQSPHLALIQYEEELSKIGNLDEKIEKLDTLLKEVQERTNKEAQDLTDKRQAGGQVLSKRLSEGLQELNIPNAKVDIRVELHPRSQRGDDTVHFYLRANQGEESVPVKESSSGGELSRLLFCLKTLLSSQGEIGTMVFDEIDANIGGETATIIGKKLKEMGKNSQLLCITHFPQVAKHGDQHLLVTKKEADARTTSKIQFLAPPSKDTELLRMLGGNLV